jgi:hypothetical protein
LIYWEATQAHHESAHVLPVQLSLGQDVHGSVAVLRRVAQHDLRLISHAENQQFPEVGMPVDRCLFHRSAIKWPVGSSLLHTGSDELDDLLLGDLRI